jgi:hypothetical protein
MDALTALAVILGAWLLISLALGHRKIRRVREGLVGGQAVVAAVAILVGVIWYAKERPDAPKFKIDVTGRPVPATTGEVLLLIDVGLENVGSTAMEFTAEDKVRLFVQRVTPIPRDVLKAMKPGEITPADNWESLSRLQHPLDTIIESGERESLFFRTLIKCQPELRVAVTARLPKPLSLNDYYAFGGPRTDEGDLWTAQQMLDLSEACATASGDRAGGVRPATLS